MLLTIERSDTSSRTTYPQGFISMGDSVSNDQPLPPGAGAVGQGGGLRPLIGRTRAVKPGGVGQDGTAI